MRNNDEPKFKDLNQIAVLHIIKSLGRGGAETLLPETLKLHNKDRFHFHYIYFLPWKDQMVRSIEQNGGFVTCIEAKNNFWLMTKLWSVARYVRQNDIRLIHAHLPWAGILARIVGKLADVPVLYTEHNKQERYHFATRAMNLISMNLATEVIAVSEDVEESIKRHKPRLKTSLLTLVNGVNADSFRRSEFDGLAIRKKLGIPQDGLVIGTVAVFRFQKRLDLWMQLASKILKENDDVHFVIVGDGPLRDDLVKLKEKLGLQDRLHMPGLETEVRPYLAAFDVYMMSSMFEGLPVAMLEAMAMECSVIATDAGGIKEVIRHEREGLLCSVEEPERLVGYATELLKKPALRSLYGSQGRKRVLESFNLNDMVQKLEGRYMMALQLGS